MQEEYYITLPTFFTHNLLIGTMRMEVGDTARIVCRATGLTATVDFNQLGMFSSSDRLNSVDGRITRGEKGREEVLAKLRGHWDKQLFLSGPTGSDEALFLDVPGTAVAPKHVLPIAAQGPWESRRLWQHAAAELKKRPTVDWTAVDVEKGQLEEEQRLLACHARAGSSEFKEWAPKMFAVKRCVGAFF